MMIISLNKQFFIFGIGTWNERVYCERPGYIKYCVGMGWETERSNERRNQ